MMGSRGCLAPQRGQNMSFLCRSNLSGQSDEMAGAGSEISGMR